jgi:hypothetical protein
MTPKEKARELVLKYLRIENTSMEWFNTHIAKQCALIAVDEILEIINETMILVDIESDYDYWQEVKEEIEKL